jgi:hypothetical protein
MRSVRKFTLARIARLRPGKEVSTTRETQDAGETNKLTASIPAQRAVAERNHLSEKRGRREKPRAPTNGRELSKPLAACFGFFITYFHDSPPERGVGFGVPFRGKVLESRVIHVNSALLRPCLRLIVALLSMLPVVNLRADETLRPQVHPQRNVEEFPPVETR